MKEDVILVTRASGHVRRRIAELLAERGRVTRRLVRSDPRRAPKLPRSEVVAGDYADPASLDRAFAGVKTAFVASVYAEPGKRAAAQERLRSRGARQGRAHYIPVVPGRLADLQGPLLARSPFKRRYLRATGVPNTALRACLYMDVLPGFFGKDGVLRGPAGNGAVAWVSREDVARTAAAVLERSAGSAEVHDVNGPEALTLPETAARLAALCGRELRYEDETLEETRRWRSQVGAPDWEVEVWIGTYLAVKAGELAPTSDNRTTPDRAQTVRLSGVFHGTSKAAGAAAAGENLAGRPFHPDRRQDRLLVRY